MTDLSPFDPSARCAKCQYDAIATDYKGRLHERCNAADAYDWYWTLARLGGVQEPEMKWLQDALARVPDHVERKCLRCSFAWAELVAA